MSLTDTEKLSGRAFRDDAMALLAELNAEDPPTYRPLPVLAAYRHACPARDLRSTSLPCHEVYLLSGHDPEHDVPAGRFGFIWREGVCRFCHAVARSGQGRIVDAWQRPPMEPIARVHRHEKGIRNATGSIRRRPHRRRPATSSPDHP